MQGRWSRAEQPNTLDASTDDAKAIVVTTAKPSTRVDESPDESMGDLFDAVQAQRVYRDGKIFADMVPREREEALEKEFSAAKQDPNFNLHDFVSAHFYEARPQPEYVYVPSSTTTAREHVTSLWPALTRQSRENQGSLIALPYAYIVPGGRFSEQFYWDGYFIMLGLAADDQWSKIQGMLRNYSYMLRRYGYIPSANRTYFLSRSQPPFFAHMVKLYARHHGRARTYAEYLPSLIMEYQFWMKGREIVGEHPDHPACERVVRLSNGSILNRYYDDKATPRPESQYEDIETAELAPDNDKDKIFIDLRAGAESGWDFSSRWFHDPNDVQSIHTTDIIAVDLNCLLYQLEQTIAEAYILTKQPMLAKPFYAAADRRADTIRRYCWDRAQGFFTDYDFYAGQTTGALTLAGVFPLYAKIATSEQAARIAQMIEQRFLQPGGLTTTLVRNGQQWDAPNGWAPLQWIAIQGLREYGYYQLADTIRDRWLATNERVFASERKMIEKYDVTNVTPGGGGEYPLQDGFGWTNGVYATLKDDQEQRHGK